MTREYYTYHIRVANQKLVQVEKWNFQNQSLGQPSGKFRYRGKLLEQIKSLIQATCNNELNDSSKARTLGEALFDILFDDVLRQDFVNFYYQVVQQEKQLLRVELDIDEQNMPEVAALPWEFMCVPARANLGTIWLGTVPDLVFSRRRSHWIAPQPIQLSKNEKLRIALVVSAPTDLAPVAYEKVQEDLENLAKEQSERVELLPIVNPANPEAINAVLTKEPHIFHFIGHGRLRDENNLEVGQVALVDELGDAMWVDADYFSGLLNQHLPGVVMLQACEGGMLSASQAFVGVAPRVVQQNIPVVVAMQYEVPNSTASRFARRFYQQLAQDEPVDIAAQYGRLAITLSPTQYKTRDFATPVIFMRVRNGHLFQRQATNSSVSHDADDLIIDILGNLYRRAFSLNFQTRFATPEEYSKVLNSIQDCHSFLQRKMVRVAATCSTELTQIVSNILRQVETMESVFRGVEPYLNGFLDGRDPELRKVFFEMEKTRVEFIINTKKLAEKAGIPLPEVPASEIRSVAHGVLSYPNSSIDELEKALCEFIEKQKKRELYDKLRRGEL
jgi:hypothetical protein